MQLLKTDAVPHLMLVYFVRPHRRDLTEEVPAKARMHTKYYFQHSSVVFSIVWGRCV